MKWIIVIVYAFSERVKIWPTFAWIVMWYCEIKNIVLCLMTTPLCVTEFCNSRPVAQPVFVNRSFLEKVDVWNLWKDAVFYSAGIWFVAKTNSTARWRSGNVESFNQQWPYKVNTIFVLGKYQSRGSRDKTFIKQTQSWSGVKSSKCQQVTWESRLFQFPNTNTVEVSSKNERKKN